MINRSIRDVYIYTVNFLSPGIKVIIEHLKIAFAKKGIVVHLTDNNCDENKIYIPYGPKESYQLAKLKRKVLFSLMVDYFSLGCKNKALFLLKNRIFTIEIVRCFLQFLLYYYRENTILRYYKKIFLVSKNDIIKLSKRSTNNEFFWVPNGFDTSSSRYVKKKSSRIRLGVLSNWTPGALAECSWFIDKYLPAINNQIPNIDFYVAGRCKNKKVESYLKGNPNIIYVGWVEDLSDFFSNVDIYVATVSRGCGILNKVLDAFAHKTLVIGHPNSFTGFWGLDNGYIECLSINDYIRAIQLFDNNKDEVEQIIENAYNYILKTNNWDKNYDDFVDKILQ